MSVSVAQGSEGASASAVWACLEKSSEAFLKIRECRLFGKKA
jgi:hypothetical protein